MRLARCFGVNARSRLNLQVAYDLRIPLGSLQRPREHALLNNRKLCALLFTMIDPGNNEVGEFIAIAVLH